MFQENWFGDEFGDEGPWKIWRKELVIRLMSYLTLALWFFSMFVACGERTRKEMAGNLILNDQVTTNIRNTSAELQEY